MAGQDLNDKQRQAGERAVKQELRKILYVRYKIKDQDLFDRAFGYVRQYY